MQPEKEEEERRREGSMEKKDDPWILATERDRGWEKGGRVGRGRQRENSSASTIVISRDLSLPLFLYSCGL